MRETPVDETETVMVILMVLKLGRSYQSCC